MAIHKLVEQEDKFLACSLSSYYQTSSFKHASTYCTFIHTDVRPFTGFSRAQLCVHGSFQVYEC